MYTYMYNSQLLWLPQSSAVRGGGQGDAEARERGAAPGGTVPPGAGCPAARGSGGEMEKMEDFWGKKWLGMNKKGEKW